MKKALTFLTLALIVAGVGFRLTHHPIYSPTCSTTDQGCAHKLIKWEGNK